jgi:hypothetical protein
MKRWRTVLLTLAVIVSAASCAKMLPYFAFREDWDYTFADGGLEFSSVDELARWMKEEIEYTDDTQLWGWTEYWASPEQTYQSRRGDCEDSAFLFMYYAYTRRMDPNPELVAVLAVGGYAHALVRVGDAYYDSESNTIRSAAEMTDPILYTLSYGQVIYIATHSHDAWKGTAAL